MHAGSVSSGSVECTVTLNESYVEVRGVINAPLRSHAKKLGITVENISGVFLS